MINARLSSSRASMVIEKLIKYGEEIEGKQ